MHNFLKLRLLISDLTVGVLEACHVQSKVREVSTPLMLKEAIIQNHFCLI